MVLDPLRVSSEPVTLVQHRHMPVGKPRAFVEMSAGSVKVRSYFRYKAIPHQWVLRSAASQAEFEKYARMPIIPLVVTPEGTGIQDSTPIIEGMEKLHPVPSIHPGDPVAGFIS